MKLLEEILDRVRAGERIAALACELDVDYTDLHGAVRVYEALSGEVLPRSKPGIAPDLNRRTAMVKAREQGLKLCEIAEMYGISVPAVSYHLRKHREALAAQVRS